jgi:hypothetical protein
LRLSESLIKRSSSAVAVTPDGHRILAVNPDGDAVIVDTFTFTFLLSGQDEGAGFTIGLGGWCSRASA